jgi:hypothetical protein
MSKNTNLSFLTDYITADITNGRIGINNASPTVAFDVVGATKITGALTLTGALGGTSATFSSNITSNGNTISVINASGSADLVLDRLNTSSGATYQYKTNGSLKWYTGLRGLANDSFYIFNNATSTNTLILDVSTNAATFSSSVTAGGWLSTANNFGLEIRNAANTAGRTAVKLNASNVLLFGQDSDITALTLGVGSEAMRITSAGNVGIGTSSPASNRKLTVAGGAQFTTGDNSGASFNIVPGATGQAGADLNLSYYTGTDYGPLTFTLGGSERVRITSGGTLVVSTNQLAPSFQSSTLILQGYNTNNSWLTDNLFYNGAGWVRSNSGYGMQIYFEGDRINTYTAGTGSAGSAATRILGPYLTNGGTSWTNSSDVRKKKNFEPTQGLAEVLQIETIKYNLITEEDGAKKRLGFKAQNIQTLIPEMISETLEKAEDGSYYLGLTQDYILPVLVKAIQELSAEINLLKQKQII